MLPCCVAWPDGACSTLCWGRAAATCAAAAAAVACCRRARRRPAMPQKRRRAARGELGELLLQGRVVLASWLARRAADGAP
eukprot:gene29320-65169_t